MSKSFGMVTVSASKSKPVAKGGKGGKHKLRHMTVTPMANGGATVEHHFMPSDEKDQYGPTPPSQTHGFTKAKDVGKHVATMLEGMPGAGANAAIDGSTNGAPPPADS